LNGSVRCDGARPRPFRFFFDNCGRTRWTDWSGSNKKKIGCENLRYYGRRRALPLSTPDRKTKLEQQEIFSLRFIDASFTKINEKARQN
jgi:hypothetical protein